VWSGRGRACTGNVTCTCVIASCIVRGTSARTGRRGNWKGSALTSLNALGRGAPSTAAGMDAR
jgi:hypothetical protein